MCPDEFAGQKSDPESGPESGPESDQRPDQKPDQKLGQERRITFQLYDCWAALADADCLPPLRALTPGSIAPYRNNMVLIDLRDLETEPTLQVIGRDLLQDLEQDLTKSFISDIPRRTLLSRITDHYLEVLGNRSPISFDAEFKNKAGEKLLYRGILLPFSDDGEEINFILGAIRWINEDKLSGTTSDEAAPEAELQDRLSVHDLGEQLAGCRKLVQGQNPTDQRSRKSLYDALGAILDFYETCCANADSYADLIAAEGLKTQKRAPFTPVLKLCFGVDYDKTRLTEYASALSYAHKKGQDGKSFAAFLDQFPGGIKGCVRAERMERYELAGKAPKDIFAESREIIEQMPVLASIELEAQYINDLCLVLARRDGTRMDIIKILDKEDKTLKKTLRQILRKILK